MIRDYTKMTSNQFICLRENTRVGLSGFVIQREYKTFSPILFLSKDYCSLVVSGIEMVHHDGKLHRLHTHEEEFISPYYWYCQPLTELLTDKERFLFELSGQLSKRVLRLIYDDHITQCKAAILGFRSQI